MVKSVVLFVLFLVSVCLSVSGFVFDVGVLRVAGFSLFALVLVEWAYDDVEGG